MSQRPNVIVILADDLGFSDIGCYGGEIATPNLDRLARDGVRMSQFYNTARCSPSRASLLTGLHPHQTGIGILTDDDRPYGYPGTLDQGRPTMAEVLRSAGYATYLSGKWHLTGQLREPDGTWPTRRGFDRFFGTIIGASDYYDPFSLYAGETPVTDLPDDFYYTNAISDAAVGFCTEHGLHRPDDPFFLYVAFTAPHWPLHAPAEAVAKYQGRYDEGWDVLRAERHRRLIEEGILDPRWTLSERDPEVPAWNDTPDQGWHARRMEVYAAQVEVMDAGIGRILDAVDALGRTDDTVVMFLSDNGGCAEDLLPACLGGRAARRPALPAGADARRSAGTAGQRARSDAGRPGHVLVVRQALGESVEHAVPRVQALGARRRHRHAVRGPLAVRARAAHDHTRTASAAGHHGHRAGDHRCGAPRGRAAGRGRLDAGHLAGR